MPYIPDKTGARFGRWVVQDRAGSIKNRAAWRCICDCGNERILSSATLTDGESLSCGCLHKERASAAARTHGRSRTRLYKVWTSMKRRCTAPKDSQYHLYGGRGITVCPEWMASFEAFAADVGERPQAGMSLDRIDNEKGYMPGNVRWATGSQQLSNTRRTIHVTYKGETMCMRDLSRRTGIAYMTLKQRLQKGWSVEAAVETPVNKRLARR